MRQPYDVLVSGQLIFFGEPLTILVVSFYDADMVVQKLTTSSGIGQSFRNGVRFSSETL